MILPCRTEFSHKCAWIHWAPDTTLAEIQRFAGLLRAFKHARMSMTGEYRFTVVRAQKFRALFDAGFEYDPTSDFDHYFTHASQPGRRFLLSQALPVAKLLQRRT
jgi:hypothetical protein